MPVSTSSLVTTRPVRPFTRFAYRSATRSSQPVRRGRPVVVPNSPPASRSCSPSWSSSSVGNGPAPTRVVYALAMPQTSSIEPRPHARARAGRAGDGVRRGHERVGAVVDVEQRALGALEHHEAALVEHAPGDRRRVGDVGLEPVAVDRGTPRSSCAGRARGASRTGAASAAWAPSRRRSSCAGSSRRAGPACGCRAARPCPRSRGRCRAAWCRSGACRASPRPPGRAACGTA